MVVGMKKERGVPVNGQASRRAINGKTIAGAWRKPHPASWPKTAKPFDGSASLQSPARKVNRDA
jgi:hypothetical protein